MVQYGGEVVTVATIQEDPLANRAPDWFAQAERDMEQATSSRDEGRHEWAR